MRYLSLVQALMTAGIATGTAQMTKSYERRQRDTDVAAAGKRMTSVNYEQQKLIHEAAIAKRERRAARNLGNAGKTQGDLL